MYLQLNSKLASSQLIADFLVQQQVLVEVSCAVEVSIACSNLIIIAQGCYTCHFVVIACVFVLNFAKSTDDFHLHLTFYQRDLAYSIDSVI